ncbi:GNAT family N-acetyltransferase [Myroides sp. WP-1]|uniref:GNAT family N-acetyltransferase n=1 Tax=Myroides sp. WP-1 TaxID=2759944 RepID=UPI0015FAC179|nr:GNAT family N-acetyltransferase [Myroides sp. WP-1]MBB1139762.1 GNAT family N-acetyltransferase [Myroides sp. WP-1]
MKKILETSRLVLRELHPSDASSFFELNANPNVIRYTGNTAFTDVEEARIFLENYSDYREKGYGRWAVVLKDTGQFIGWCGLKFDADTQQTDIGFRFFEEEWGKGYATESAQACLQVGFNQFQLSHIIGRAMKANIASICVLEKLGLTYEQDIILDGEEAVLYKIKK